jgi:putative ABC transport system substrate-binding protein
MDKATAAVIRVGDGRGFVVEGERERFVITAAHCLPHLPPCHPAAYEEELTYQALLGPLGNSPTTGRLKRDMVSLRMDPCEEGHTAMRIGRRQLLAVLGGAAAWPLAARAQQRTIPVIGFLHSAAMVIADYRLSAFGRGLNDVGFAEGRNLAIEFCFANEQRDRIAALAANLVRRDVAVIVVNGVSLLAAMAATSTIPIVFVGGIDPVERGLVARLSRPSGNLTGVSFFRSPLNTKRLQFLHELLPKPALIAVLVDPTQLQDLIGAARSLGRRVLVVKAASEGELDTAFTTILQAAAGALFVGSSSFFVSERRKLVTFAAGHALPASYDGREFVEIGGLMSYDASVADAYRRGGVYVGRILKGAKPSDLPIELPTKFDLVINLTTAKALGLAVPSTLLALANEVIE